MDDATSQSGIRLAAESVTGLVSNRSASQSSRRRPFAQDRPSWHRERERYFDRTTERSLRLDFRRMYANTVLQSGLDSREARGMVRHSDWSSRAFGNDRQEGGRRLERFRSPQNRRRKRSSADSESRFCNDASFRSTAGRLSDERAISRPNDSTESPNFFPSL